MSSLLRSLSMIWRDSQDLCALVPYVRVYTGRVPQTELYKFPYVSILATQGSQLHRTDKTRYSSGPVTFHVWVDEDELETGERIAQAITDEYADRCWDLCGEGTVIDMLDEGEACAEQVDHATIKAWEVIKLFTAIIERPRVERTECCASVSDSGDCASGSSSST